MYSSGKRRSHRKDYSNSSDVTGDPGWSAWDLDSSRGHFYRPWKRNDQDAHPQTANEHDHEYEAPTKAPSTADEYGYEYEAPTEAPSTADEYGYEYEAPTKASSTAAQEQPIQQMTMAETYYPEDEYCQRDEDVPTSTYDDNQIPTSYQQAHTAATETLDKRFRIPPRPSRFFKTGRVFKILWTEPAGNVSENDSDFVNPAKFGELAYTKIRHFVVIRTMQGCSLCLPLNTFSRQGVEKGRIRAQDYAAVYPVRSEPQIGAFEKLTKQSFPIILDDPRDTIDPKSRLNFGQVHTIQHNLKVLGVGRIPDEHLALLDKYFLETIAGAPDQITREVPTKLENLSLQPLASSASRADLYTRYPGNDINSGYKYSYGDLRSDGGCWICLLRKIPCDKESPSCAECQTLDWPCEYKCPVWWYDSDFRYGLADEINNRLAGQSSYISPVHETSTGTNGRYSAYNMDGSPIATAQSYSPPLGYSTSLSACYAPSIVPEPLKTSMQQLKEVEKLDPEFKVHNSRYFKPGHAFKVFWSEPKGETSSHAHGSSPASLVSRFGTEAFTSVRRFIIVASDTGHSQCLPILTYGRQSLAKPGINPEVHAPIYNENGPLKEIPSNTPLQPIQFVPKNLRHKLAPGSVINYTKIYTVEHNVRVIFIGRIAKDSERAFANDFDATWDKKRKLNPE